MVAVVEGADAGRGPAWLVEQRYRAVLEVLDGSPVSEVAIRYGVSRQTIYAWKAKHEAGGLDGLKERSRRPHNSPNRLPAAAEALACEMRRANPRWGARRIAYEIARTGIPAAPSRATVHRALERNGLIRHQKQQHRRKYKRWQRETPMHLWQMDLVGGIFLSAGRECKMLTGIDDHSRSVVVSTVLAVPSGRAVADAFVRAMRVYGVPAEVLTDNGKQFTGRFTKPRPAEVLFERVCRENGITAKLIKPYSPTTTGKIERWHQTLRRELLDVAGAFADLPAAQAAVDAWVHTYNTAHPHQALKMAAPASLFRPNPQPEPTTVVPVRAPDAEPELVAEPQPAALLMAGTGPAMEFETIVTASGHVGVLPRIQRVRLSNDHAGRKVRVWVDELTIHISLDGEVLKSAASRLDADNLRELSMRGAVKAGPPPAAPAVVQRGRLEPGAVIEVDRNVDGSGIARLGSTPVKIGYELANRRVTLRLDGHLMHVVHDAVLAKTLPAPIESDQRANLRGARLAAEELPPPVVGAIRVERKVPVDGVIMVARQRLRVGRTYAGETVTIHVEDTYFRITLNDAELALHPRKNRNPVTRFRAKIHAPKL
ncbi:IS481 family transposase [Streptomyces sp. AP-93]|uniref:IS481 family transposase n=1 Tax=Streptomyces sp. AP-93 TaxID=2929048 RepID=UPI001FB036D1|nr:IS481 family transposase [Streptomyces sp. AP-93]MCJ0872551.1 IS481 family transposase [Streptomyces sp. AP-93]